MDSRPREICAASEGWLSDSMAAARERRVPPSTLAWSGLGSGMGGSAPLFAAGDPAADCDGSGGLDFFDFLCFQNAFAAGCP